MGLMDADKTKVHAVVRRARMSFKSTFYIYTPSRLILRRSPAMRKLMAWMHIAGGICPLPKAAIAQKITSWDNITGIPRTLLQMVRSTLTNLCTFSKPTTQYVTRKLWWAIYQMKTVPLRRIKKILMVQALLSARSTEMDSSGMRPMSMRWRWLLELTQDL